MDLRDQGSLRPRSGQALDSVAQDDKIIQWKPGSLRSLDSRGRLSLHAHRRYCSATFMFRLWATKAQVSAVSSINFVIDLPAPWPAFTSMRISTGAGPA